MSSFSGITSQPRRASIFKQDNPLDALEFDAILTENHQGTATVTDHPIEKGSDITDHVRRSPESLSCRAIVSNHPILVLRSLNARPSVRGGDPDSRAEQAYGFLKELLDGGVIVGFTTTLRDYQNMVITSLAVNRDASSGNIVDIQLTIREIIIATTDTTDVPEPVNPSRQNKTNLGKKPKSDASPATTDKTEGLLETIFNIFGG